MSSVSREQHLKQLRTRKQKLDGEVAALDQEQRDAQRRYNERIRQRDEIAKSIEELEQQASEPGISEHALVRYCERIKGLDFDSIRDEMLEGRREQIAFMGSGQIDMGDGHKMVIKNRIVVTVK